MLPASVTGKLPVFDAALVNLLVPSFTCQAPTGKVQFWMVRFWTLAVVSQEMSLGLVPSCLPRWATLIGAVLPYFPSKVQPSMVMAASRTAHRFRSMVKSPVTEVAPVALFLKVQFFTFNSLVLVRYRALPG